jgi:hypothetical protein
MWTELRTSNVSTWTSPDDGKKKLSLKVEHKHFSLYVIGK